MPDIAGLKLIVPTSVASTGAGSSATVSATGKITFTSVETLTIENCFSTTYDNYLIVARHVTSLDGRSLRYNLRVGGSNAVGANYTSQRVTASSTTVSGARLTSQTDGIFTFSDDEQRSGSHTFFYGPFLAQPTAVRSISVAGDSGAAISDWASTHSLSTSYTSLYLYPDGGNMTGALTIYGLAQ